MKPLEKYNLAKQVVSGEVDANSRQRAKARQFIAQFEADQRSRVEESDVSTVTDLPEMPASGGDPTELTFADQPPTTEQLMSEEPEPMEAGEPIDLSAREPVLRGRGGMAMAYRHTEPSVQDVMDNVAAMAGDGDQEAAERIYVDLESRGKESPYYGQYADYIWAKVHDAFEEKGLPAVRVEKADMSMETAIPKIGAQVLTPLALGADIGASLGLGRELAATVGPAIADITQPEESAVVRELEQQGILPGAAGEADRIMEANPVTSLMGGLAGMRPTAMTMAGPKAIAEAAGKRMMPGNPAAVAARGLAGALPPAARWAAGGALASTAFGVGERSVRELGRAVRGEDTSLERVTEPMGKEALIGAAGGVALQRLVARAQAKRAKMRLGQGPIADDIGKIEKAEGGGTSIIHGVREPAVGEQYRAMTAAQRAAEPHKWKGVEDVVASDLSERGVAFGVADQEARILRHELQTKDLIEKETKRLGDGVLYPVNAFKKIWDTAALRSGTMQAGRDVTKSLRREVSKVDVFIDNPWSAKRAAAGTPGSFGIDPQEAAEFGVIDLVNKELARKKTGIKLGKDGSIVAGGRGDVIPDDMVKIVVSPKGQRGLAKLEESISGLDRQARWESASGAQDEFWTQVAVAVRKDREGISKELARLKDLQNAEILPSELAAMKTIGHPSWKARLRDKAERAFVAFANLPEGTKGTGRDAVLDYFRKDPTLMRDIINWEAWRTYRKHQGIITKADYSSPVPSVTWQAAKRTLPRIPYSLDALRGHITQIPMQSTGLQQTVDVEVPAFISEKGADAEALWGIMRDVAMSQHMKRKKK